MKTTIILLALVVICSESLSQDSWKNYRDADHGFEIKYPAGYTVNKSYKYEYNSLSIHGVQFMIPKDYYEGTNLSDEAFISVEWQLLNSKDTIDFIGKGITADETEGSTAGGTQYVIDETSEAAAGNIYEQVVYIVKGSKYFLAVRLFMHSGNIHNYDPGNVRAFDRAKLKADFYQMVGKLKAI